MYDEQTRINATINYLFLGPIILLAKKDTPLAEKYVQNHAKRASLLILGSLGAYLVYYFIRDFLSISLFGISLTSVILAILVTAILTILLHGAYYAYSGREAATLKLGDMLMRGSNSGTSTEATIERTDVSGYSEEEKIRIVASFLPFIGIFLSSRSDRTEIATGRKVGTFAVAVIIISSVLTDSAGLSVLFSLVYIGVIVITLVGLFVQKQFFSLGVYHYIPTYIELETHFFASIEYSWMFTKVIFGSEKKTLYKELYESISVKGIGTNGGNPETDSGGQAPYFMPLWIVGLPVVNLITVPSFFNTKYSLYKNIILQGFVLTVLFFIIWMTYGWNSNIQMILLFPIIHLLCFAAKDPATRAPIVSLGIALAHLFRKSTSHITELANNEEKVTFSYETKPAEAEEKIANL